ncbi:MAG: gliding motility lipoprotein GldB [Bacteroidetes bacterium]|nr:gliding motility lipoprotein GldB [Bacteroidota bacterium]
MNYIVSKGNVKKKKGISSIVLLSLVFVSFLILTSCNQCNKKRTEKVDVSEVPEINVKIKRYEKALFSINPNNLKAELKPLVKDYGIFLGGANLNDSVKLLDMKEYLTAPQIQEAYHAIIKEFPDVSDLEKQFSSAFKYFKHYYPEKKIPTIYTYVSGYAYEFPVQFADSALIIGLDLYLGKNFKFYKMFQLPVYKTDKMQREFILPDCMKEIAYKQIDGAKVENTFIDKMVYEGKVIYFIDAMLPEAQDSLKMGYSSKQMDWCEKNESNVWAFFLEKNILYSTDPNLYKKFISDAPFTSTFSKQSPGRIGAWIGWQIVQAYMEKNPKVTLAELMKDNDAKKILSKSRYKPKK